MNRDTGNVQTVTVEYGFASNPEDAKFIKNNWEFLADATVRAFIKNSNILCFK